MNPGKPLSWQEIERAIENTSPEDLAIFMVLYYVDENGNGRLKTDA